jgi:EAL domain-containing protein (putative c-di-GMP-specific phosphodiesterase class I)
VGGDEFAIATICEDAKVSAECIAERIIAACKIPVDFKGKQLHFGASIGIALIDRPDLKDLTENADIALYEAKAAGRNRYAFFTPELRAIAENKKRMADDLLWALADDQICAHFQPQVSAHSGALEGVEALARWHHPVSGLILPEVFLPVAEELGLIDEIDAIVLSNTLAMARRLGARGIDLPKVSVNVSYRRLREENLLARLDQLQPWPCRLAFELLETTDYEEEADGFNWILDGLRDRNIEIELDDFGSGRASITTLLKLRPDRIKIDRKIVAAVASEVPEANPLVQAIGEMAKALGIRMTAEGVETELQACVLRSLGCETLQGYLFSPALSEHDLAIWIMRNGRRSVRTRGAVFGQPTALL